jgi:hypothetical protein
LLCGKNLLLICRKQITENDLKCSHYFSVCILLIYKQYQYTNCSSWWVFIQNLIFLAPVFNWLSMSNWELNGTFRTTIILFFPFHKDITSTKITYFSMLCCWKSYQLCVTCRECSSTPKSACTRWFYYWLWDVKQYEVGWYPIILNSMTTGQLYCGIFAQSQGTLLSNGTTNACTPHRWRRSTMKQLREAVFSTRSDARRTVTLQWNTSHYVAHINRVTARSVFCGVRRWELWVSSEIVSGSADR